MKLIHTIVIIFVCFFTQAQITHLPTPAMMVAPNDSTDTKLIIKFKSEFEEDTKIYWKIIKDSLTWKSPWISALCDNNSCYLDNVDRSNPFDPNIFQKADYNWEFYFKPGFLAGSTIVQLVLYTDRNFTEEIYRTKIFINLDPTSSKDIIQDESLLLFPNPTSDFFTISSEISVNKVTIYDMFGKEVKVLFNQNNTQHDVTDLKSGMYIIKMVDEKNKIIKSVKLQKINSGA